MQAGQGSERPTHTERGECRNGVRMCVSVWGAACVARRKGKGSGREERPKEENHRHRCLQWKKKGVMVGMLLAYVRAFVALCKIA
jgi:hypothetical protein